jgi:hypothetical protein
MILKFLENEITMEDLISKKGNYYSIEDIDKTFGSVEIISPNHEICLSTILFPYVGNGNQIFNYNVVGSNDQINWTEIVCFLILISHNIILY